MNHAIDDDPIRSVDMPWMVSYAQHGEDILLRRALFGVEKGTFVDVGAAWPIADSVTKYFSDEGWSGINIEPNPAFFAELVANRPNDTNLNIAVGAEAGTAHFAVLDGTGLSTFDFDRARWYAGEGFNLIDIEVETLPLREVFAQHIGDKPVHFLKVDVEGLEEIVLASNDWSKYRPWIVLAEVGDTRFSLDPEPWEVALQSHGYVRAHDDGLNRWYVDDAAHPELKDRLRIGACPNDHYRTFRDLELDRVINMATTQHGQLVEAQARIDALEAEVAQLKPASSVAADARSVSGPDSGATPGPQAGEASGAQQTVPSSTDEVEPHQHAADLGAGQRNSSRPIRIASSLVRAPGPGLKYIGFRLLRGKLGTSNWVAQPEPASD